MDFSGSSGEAFEGMMMRLEGLPMGSDYQSAGRMCERIVRSETIRFPGGIGLVRLERGWEGRGAIVRVERAREHSAEEHWLGELLQACHRLIQARLSLHLQRPPLCATIDTPTILPVLLSPPTPSLSSLQPPLHPLQLPLPLTTPIHFRPFPSNLNPRKRPRTNPSQLPSDHPPFSSKAERLQQLQQTRAHLKSSEAHLKAGQNLIRERTR
ncbi:hypothetical protein VP01_130g1 [Puccinia sorghi]|uniref:Uncharacterized protein n=1 Tax=Puccinia sorghi TaxID=27349 RepID=A0A0L6VMY6_9BASI|nr:hypothetical protein VP01_130g1 [Puccinia sorghi]